MAAVLALLVHLSGALSSAELLVRDAMLRHLPSRPATHVAVVLVDDQALRLAGPWPWKRETLARLVDEVFATGAKGVVVDLLLPEAREGDAELALALGKGPSVLAVGLDEGGDWLPPTPILRNPSLGHVSFDLDRDGVVRRFSSTKQRGERLLPALPVAAARLGNAQFPVPIDVVLRPGFRTHPIPSIGAWSLLQGNRPGVLRNRIVFVGTSAAGVGDRFVSPISTGGSPEPGVMIEAISAEAILSRDLLRTVSPLIHALLTLGLSALLWLVWDRSRLILVPLIFAAPFLLAIASLVVFRLEMAPVAALPSLIFVGILAGVERSRRARLTIGVSRTRIQELEDLQVSIDASRKTEAEARRVMAHELKTPLTSVRGLTQLLSKFDLSPQERDRVAGLVISETARLSQMVDALLDLERLCLRDYHQEAQNLDLSSLCAERVEVLRAGSEREIDAELATGLIVRGDRSLLERVLENLVSNAFKFSPEGAAIRILLARDGNHSVLLVEDQGPGIPIQERTLIFGRFTRGSTRGLAQGLGLGLALVAEVVDWHHGTVEVDEGSHGGSIFRVRLPLASN